MGGEFPFAYLDIPDYTQERLDITGPEIWRFMVMGFGSNGVIHRLSDRHDVQQQGGELDWQDPECSAIAIIHRLPDRPGVQQRGGDVD